MVSELSISLGQSLHTTSSFTLMVIFHPCSPRGLVFFIAIIYSAFFFNFTTKRLRRWLYPHMRIVLNQEPVWLGTSERFYDIEWRFKQFARFSPSSERRCLVCFASSKCRLLLQDWIGSKPEPVLAKEHLGEMDRFGYLGSWISPDGC